MFERDWTYDWKSVGSEMSHCFTDKTRFWLLEIQKRWQKVNGLLCDRELHESSEIGFESDIDFRFNELK